VLGVTNTTQAEEERKKENKTGIIQSGSIHLSGKNLFVIMNKSALMSLTVRRRRLKYTAPTGKLRGQIM
jgi:hypothetical protein